MHTHKVYHEIADLKIDFQKHNKIFFLCLICEGIRLDICQNKVYNYLIYDFR